MCSEWRLQQLQVCEVHRYLHVLSNRSDCITQLTAATAAKSIHTGASSSSSFFSLFLNRIKGGRPRYLGDGVSLLAGGRHGLVRQPSGLHGSRSGLGSARCLLSSALLSAGRAAFRCCSDNPASQGRNVMSQLEKTHFYLVLTTVTSVFFNLLDLDMIQLQH